MKIKIDFRLKPYSHTPGMGCLIPGTHSTIQAYPTLLRIDLREIPISVTGPVRNFTLEQDLERGCVWVSGHAKEGFYRLKIFANADGFEIFADKTPQNGLMVANKTVHLKEKLRISEKLTFSLPEKAERLSLGQHKDLDWDLVWKRMDLSEILPVLFDLAQKTPLISQKPKESVSSLLEKDFASFCKVAFTQILVPRTNDDQHLGLGLTLDEDPKRLLKWAGFQIRSLFFKQSDLCLSILPNSCFPAGRLIGIQAQNVGEIDLEWRKGMPRQICLRAKKSSEILFDLPKEIESYRIRTHLNEKGFRQKSHAHVAIKENQTYYLDRFQK